MRNFERRVNGTERILKIGKKLRELEGLGGKIGVGMVREREGDSVCRERKMRV